MEYQDFLEAKARRLRLPPLCDMEDERHLSVFVRDMGNVHAPATYIYGLSEIGSNAIRYIGKSDAPAQRFRSHLNERSNCHRAHWIRSLKAKGLRPRLTVLEPLGYGQCWQEAERRWIAFGRSQGWPLTNNTSGGDGVCDLPPETRERMRNVWLGRKHTPETIERLKIARNLRPGYSEGTKAKMREAMKGRVITWADKVAEGVRKLSEQQVSEIRQRIESGEFLSRLADEFGVHRTTLMKVKAGTYFLRYKRSPGAAA